MQGTGIRVRSKEWRMLSRRQFSGAVPAVLGSSTLLAACSAGRSEYDAAAAGTWRIGNLHALEAAALSTELVR
jgi:hypothetical protein